MWPQSYTPIADSLPISAIVAGLPILTMLVLLGIFRKPAWIASLAGVVVAALVALFAYGMPASMVVSSALYGAAYGLLPIGWIVFTAILLYRLTVETGNFEIIKDSIASLTGDRRLQALLIAFAFGAFLEGAAGFGTPVAVASAMLAGLGFEPFFAAGICLLANTSPVAFGSIGVPIYTLRSVAGFTDILPLSSNVGRICAPLALFVPAYLMLVMGGWKALKAVFPAAAVAGITFAATEFLVSTYIRPGRRCPSRRHRFAGRPFPSDDGLEAQRIRRRHAASAHRRQCVSRVVPVSHAGRFRGTLGNRCRQWLARSNHALSPEHLRFSFARSQSPHLRVAGPPQSGAAHSARRESAVSLRRGIQAESPVGLRHLVPVLRLRLSHDPARLARPLLKCTGATA